MNKKMKKILFIDDGIEFDSITAREKSTGGAESAFVSLAEAFAKKITKCAFIIIVKILD